MNNSITICTQHREQSLATRVVWAQGHPGCFNLKFLISCVRQRFEWCIGVFVRATCVDAGPLRHIPVLKRIDSIAANLVTIE